METTRALVNVVNPVRRWLLYFAGATEKPSSGYAVRRLLMDALRGREAEGIRLVERDEDHYVENLAASTFCLAPTGTGWGRRVGLAAQFGCIPVIVQDSVRQAFDDVLPYDAFTVRFQESDIPNIPGVLKAIPESCEGVPPGGRCLERMRAQLACAIRALTWSSAYGSLFGESGSDDAFAFTMLSLQHRLATYVKPEGRARNPWTPKIPMRNACAMVETLSCIRVPAPLCRNPCETTIRASQREKVFGSDGVDAVAGGGRGVSRSERRARGGEHMRERKPTAEKHERVAAGEHDARGTRERRSSALRLTFRARASRTFDYTFVLYIWTLFY